VASTNISSNVAHPVWWVAFQVCLKIDGRRCTSNVGSSIETVSRCGTGWGRWRSTSATSWSIVRRSAVTFAGSVGIGFVVCLGPMVLTQINTTKQNKQQANHEQTTPTNKTNNRNEHHLNEALIQTNNTNKQQQHKQTNKTNSTYKLKQTTQ
jgi:hypothetical protein